MVFTDKVMIRNEAILETDWSDVLKYVLNNFVTADNTANGKH